MHASNFDTRSMTLLLRLFGTSILHFSVQSTRFSPGKSFKWAHGDEY